MRAIIEVEVPDYQIGQEVNIYFKDTMMIKGIVKEPKWDRLYGWLNDMRYGIAPDETVDDVDERMVRVAQTDIIDDIIEYMNKAESEPQESEE